MEEQSLLSDITHTRPSSLSAMPGTTADTALLDLLDKKSNGTQDDSTDLQVMLDSAMLGM